MYHYKIANIINLFFYIHTQSEYFKGYFYYYQYSYYN